MNRSLWKQTLTKTSCPAWPCPVCRKGILALVHNSLIYKETIGSMRMHHQRAWDPDCIEYTFTAWAECRHPQCKQEFAIGGKGGVGPEIGADGDYDWVEYFSPMLCQPMPDIIDIPEKCPVEVKDELQTAFALFWAHRNACAGRIRVGLECLMNHLGVPKRKRAKLGTYADLTLHSRIDTFAKKQPTVGPQLMALKWLGNTGSHHGQVSQEDVLDAFEIMEHALGEIIDRRSAKVAKLAKKLTKKHCL